MKRLMTDKGQYTDDAANLSDEVRKALHSVLGKWIQEYDSTDIYYVLQQATDIEFLAWKHTKGKKQ